MLCHCIWVKLHCVLEEIYENVHHGHMRILDTPTAPTRALSIPASGLVMRPGFSHGGYRVRLVESVTERKGLWACIKPLIVSIPRECGSIV